MKRALELASLGLGHVAPNPMVGAVLVHEGRIIGEGYHQSFGGPHAEVNCLASVAETNRHLIPHTTLYVTLEPCCHHGKTPPCTDLIIQNGIKKVVIAMKDPFEKVNGSGYQQLRTAGIEIIEGIMEAEARFLNRRFFTFNTTQRPYVILKWAQTADGFMAGQDGATMKISHASTDQWVHQWRSEEQAIFVGTDTAIRDNPQLSNRLWTGAQPIRMAIDRQLKIPATHHLFNQQQATIIFNEMKAEVDDKIEFVKMIAGGDLCDVLNQYCYDHGILSVIVEGGRKILDYFLQGNKWDEIRRITATAMTANNGIKAPELIDFHADIVHWVHQDQIEIAYQR